MNIKILLLTRYTAKGASSRLRSFQFAPELQKLGFEVSIAPLFGDAYLQSLYNSSSWAVHRFSQIGNILATYMRRLHHLFQHRSADVVWVEKELFPYLPAAFETLLSRSGVPYVVDYDDAVFHNYDLHTSRLVRTLLGNKLRPLLRSAFAVTAGNSYLADYARSQGAGRVELVPTVVDVGRYTTEPRVPGGPLRIGWIGSPSTSQYLDVVAGALRRLSRSKDILLVTVGAKAQAMPGVAVQEHDWQLGTEAELIQGFDVGIMPLHDSPWERGKCGYKLIQYMSSGKPVVASPIGVNTEIVSSDVGLLAENEDAWVQHLSTLAEQPERRGAMGLAGRARVEREYSLQVAVPKVAHLLSAAAKGVG